MLLVILTPNKVSVCYYGITLYLTEYSSLYGDYNDDITSYTSIEHVELA